MNICKILNKILNNSVIFKSITFFNNKYYTKTLTEDKKNHIVGSVTQHIHSYISTLYLKNNCTQKRGCK